MSEYMKCGMVEVSIIFRFPIRRIRHMSMACYDIWLSKVLGDFRKYLTDATAPLGVQQRTLENSARG